MRSVPVGPERPSQVRRANGRYQSIMVSKDPVTADQRSPGICRCRCEIMSATPAKMRLPVEAFKVNQRQYFLTLLPVAGGAAAYQTSYCPPP